MPGGVFTEGEPFGNEATAFIKEQIMQKEVEIEVDGSGNSRVYATDTLIFESEGSGKVDVFGKPKNVQDRTKRKSKIRIR